MSFRFSNEYTLLWKEEPDCLAQYASAVPDGGCIVEIGTAEGGSAKIMREVTASKNIQIYTVDLLPRDKAFELLKDSNVTLLHGASVQFAKNWDKSQKIDLLFIDGDHSFNGIYEDFVSWCPFLSDEGKVLFHDVDLEERGGLAHLGVQVFVDSILREGILKDSESKYRFLYGKVDGFSSGTLNKDIFIETLRLFSEGIKNTCDRFFAEGPENAIKLLRERAFQINSLHVCCCVGRLLNEHYPILLEAGNKYEIMRWAEAVWMLEHAFEDFVRPESFDVSSFDGLETYTDISKFIAKLHSTIFLYKNITTNILKWDL
jgi:hypothetical protein